MIDCHAHVFPELDEMARKLPGPARGAVLALERVLRLPGASRLVRGLPLDVEKLAETRRRLPGPLRQIVETVLSLGIAPAILLGGSVRKLRESMARNGVLRTVVIAAHPTTPNEWLLGQVRGATDLVPVAHVPELPPGTPEAAWRDAFDALAKDGFSGFKIHPNMDGREGDDPAYRALFAAAEAHHKFVILHTGHFSVPGYRKRGPSDAQAFAPLFQAFPAVRVCLAHLNRDAPEAIWPLLAQHAQLFADTSWQTPDSIRRTLAEVGPDRLVLGSDWPLLHTELQADALAVLRAGAGAQAGRIGLDSARRLLGT